MQAWFWIALVAPAIFAASNHLDKYLLGRYFKGLNPLVLVVFSSLIGIFIAPIVLIFNSDAFSVTFLEATTLAASGILFVVALIPYLFALDTDDASIVVPLFQIIPVYSYFLGLLILGEQLAPIKIIGALMIIGGAVGMTLDFSKARKKFKAYVFWLMVLASFIIALDTLLFKLVTVESRFWVGSFWKYIGFIIPGAVILFVSATTRRKFVGVLRQHSARVISLNVLNELLNTVGVLAINFAILLAPLAAVMAVNGFQPFFVFIYGVLLTLFFPGIAKETLVRRVLIQKIAFIVVIFFGSYLLNR